ncbi:MAG: hypothetical protein WCO91_07500 [Gemmataceae bacterium]
MTALVLIFCQALIQQISVPGLHAHNDYLHKRPLLEALEQGFDSVEADVFLKNGKLLVGHFDFALSADRTLASLYLVPLSKLHKEGKLKAMWLMIDIKSSDGLATAKAIEGELVRFPELFQRVGDKNQKPVKVLLSGNMPRDWVLGQKTPLLRVDGRIGDLGVPDKADLIPWVSEPWSKHFDWNGTGPMPLDQLEKLEAMARKAASARQQLRFWGAPDLPECWQNQRKAGIQRIGTDKLEQLAKAIR